jgi:hypothetical protein
MSRFARRRKITVSRSVPMEFFRTFAAGKKDTSE